GHAGRRGSFPQGKACDFRLLCAPSRAPEARLQARAQGGQSVRSRACSVAAQAFLPVLVVAQAFLPVSRAQTTADPAFFATKLYPILEAAQCRGCHARDGVASATR